MQILSCKVGIDSAKLLGTAYQEEYGNPCRVTMHVESIHKKDPYVRWGSLSTHINLPDSLCNPVGFVHLCGDKLLFSKRMEELKIKSPIYHMMEPSEYPILVRTTLTGHGGMGIHKVFNREQWEPYTNSMWTKLYKVNKEYRAHILGGKVSRLFRKVPLTDTVEEYPIYNIQDGYRFLLVDHEKAPRTTAFCEKIAKAIPEGQFYVLDVGLLDDSSFIVFEANSAPSLNENIIKRYLRYIMSKMEKVQDAISGTTQDITGTGGSTSSN